MNYLDTAFLQLEFAIKLMHAAEQGKVDVKEIDVPLTVEHGKSFLVLRDKVLSSEGDLVNACENNLSITFGAAAITLNRCREECGLKLPDPIQSELDQWTALVYQTRNAFAHDISEPRWSINGRYARPYKIRNLLADLTNLDGQSFEYKHIGGIEALFCLKRYAQETFFP